MRDSFKRGVPGDVVFITYNGDAAALYGDEHASSKYNRDGELPANWPASAISIAGACSQRLAGAVVEEKFAAANTVAIEAGDLSGGAIVLPNPSAETPETPHKPMSKLAVAPAQKRNIRTPVARPAHHL
jgi:hypothetical protein